MPGSQQEQVCRSCYGTGKATPIKCYHCNGTGYCGKCKGSKKVDCQTCQGNGQCGTCYPYRVEWKEATDLAKAGDAYNAVASLLEMLKEFDQAKRDLEQQAREQGIKDKNTGRTAGVGIGAILGTFIIPIPVVGTVIGSAIGGLIGNNAADPSKAVEDKTIPFQAETHYRLGVIYEMLHNPAALQHFTQARLLNSTHEGAIEALKRLQPTIPISPQLAALDDGV